MTASNSALILAMKSAQGTAPAVTQAQFSGPPTALREDPWVAAIREIGKGIAKFDLEFETASVKEGKRPSFITVLAHMVPNMTLMELEVTAESKGAVSPSIASNPEYYLKNRELLTKALKVFNDMRTEGEPEAKLQTLADFLTAKRQQAKLLGHEMRNPLFTPERYREMYPIVLGRVDESARKSMSREFGDAPDKAPTDHHEHDSFALYRMFDSGELRAVASGRDISPGCQVQAACYTAVGSDFHLILTTKDGYAHLMSRGNMRDKAERKDMARHISDALYNRQEMRNLERYGKEPSQRNVPDSREASTSSFELSPAITPADGRAQKSAAAR